MFSLDFVTFEILVLGVTFLQTSGGTSMSLAGQKGSNAYGSSEQLVQAYHITVNI